MTPYALALPCALCDTMSYSRLRSGAPDPRPPSTISLCSSGASSTCSPMSVSSRGAILSPSPSLPPTQSSNASGFAGCGSSAAPVSSTLAVLFMGAGSAFVADDTLPGSCASTPASSTPQHRHSQSCWQASDSQVLGNMQMCLPLLTVFPRFAQVSGMQVGQLQGLNSRDSGGVPFGCGTLLPTNGKMFCSSLCRHPAWCWRCPDWATVQFARVLTVHTHPSSRYGYEKSRLVSITWVCDRSSMILTYSFLWDVIKSLRQISFNLYHLPLPHRRTITCNPPSHISVDGVYQ
jgi:hypothetical protein